MVIFSPKIFTALISPTPVSVVIETLQLHLRWYSGIWKSIFRVFKNKPGSYVRTQFNCIIISMSEYKYNSSFLYTYIYNINIPTISEWNRRERERKSKKASPKAQKDRRKSVDEREWWFYLSVIWPINCLSESLFHIGIINDSALLSKWRSTLCPPPRAKQTHAISE